MKIIILFIITSSLISFAYSQDPNLSNMKDLTGYEYEYDSLNNYYSLIQYNFNDNHFGVSQRAYIGPDSIWGHADYMTLAPYDEGKILRKGLAFEALPTGTFIGIKYFDWSGDLHGNMMRFHPNGSLKINEVWDRGILIKSWEYNEDGELIEYKDYDKDYLER